MKKSMVIMSILIILIMILGGFGYIVANSNGSYTNAGNLETKDSNIKNVGLTGTGDTIYITDTYIINRTTVGGSGEYGFDANVVVTSSGKLIVENVTLYFLSDIDHRYSLTVEGGLYFYNVTFTISHGLIKPYYPFNFVIKGPSNAEVEIINSRLLYPGWFNVTDKHGNILIQNTIFGKMAKNPADYPAPPDYGPTPYFQNSLAYIMNTQFTDIFTNETGGNGLVGYINDTHGYTVTKTSGALLDHFLKNPIDKYSDYWNYVMLKNIEVEVIYSNKTGYNPSSSNFIMTYNGTQLLNISFPGAVGTGMIKGSVPFYHYEVTPDQFYQKILNGEINMYVTNTTNSTLTVSKVYINVKIEANLLKYGINKFSFNSIDSTLYMRDVYVDVNYQSRTNLGTTHNIFFINDNSKIYALNLTLNDTGTQPRYDTTFLMRDSNSQVYILRYVNAYVQFHGAPIDGLKVKAEPNPVDSNSNPNIVPQMLSIISNYVQYTRLIPSMKLGNVQVSNGYVYDTTVNGNVSLPLLSDIINASEEPNSKYVGIYNLYVENSTKVFSTLQIGLGYYPWLLPANNTLKVNVVLSKYKDVDMCINYEGVASAEPYLPGKNIAIKTQVENLGKDIASDVKLYVYINGALYNIYNLGNINGKDKKNFTYQINGDWLSTNGIYNISEQVVQVWDYNSNNNKMWKDVPVGSISVSSWEVGEVIRYHDVWVNVTIKSVYAWNGVQINLYLDNTSTLINSTTINLKEGNDYLSFQWYVNQSISPGTHELLLYIANSNLYLDSYSINVEESINLAITSLSISPQSLYVGETVNIAASVVNLGKEEPSSAMVYISVYDPYGSLVINKTISYSPSINVYSLSIVPEIDGSYQVTIKVVASGDYDSSNNIMTRYFIVYAEPFSVNINVQNEYVNGTNVVVNVTLDSEVNANVTMLLYIPQWNIEIAPITPKNPIEVKTNTPILVGFLIPKSLYEKYIQGRASIQIDYQINITSDVTGDALYIHTAPTITVREKVNFVLTDFVITEGSKEVSKVPEGVKINIGFIVRNMGGIAGKLEYIVLDNGKIIYKGNVSSLAPGSYKAVVFNYTINGIGNHNIVVKLNPNKTVEESVYGDDVGAKKIEVILPAMNIMVTSYSFEHNEKIYAGDTLVVVVKIINLNATQSQGKTVYMKDVTVKLTLTGGLGTYTEKTNAYGLATFHIKVPASGTYTPQLTLSYEGTETKYNPQTTISVQEKPFTIPWLWIIIIVVVGAVAGFFLYGYISFKKEAPEYMVCGNCGHLVPADAEKCPYCGVVFEKEKVKCPTCGSWIDEDSKFCPVCGTIFMPPEDPEYNKYEKLKENYEKYIRKYKEEAKKYIGEEYTEEEFYKWWKTNPEFISFLEWVKRQEEKIEGDTVKCPVCGALNPKGAKICRVCGSPLPTEGEKKKKEEGKQPPEKEEKKESPIPPEELERLQRPGVVTVEEWAKKKEKEEKKEEGNQPPEKEEKKEEEKPVIKKKLIKKVIAVRKEEEK